jgi:hypothetical protein
MDPFYSADMTYRLLPQEKCKENKDMLSKTTCVAITAKYKVK